MKQRGLFDALDAARAQGYEAGDAAASRAERLDPGWRSLALEAVREYARQHLEFKAEEVGMVIPPDADPRSSGSIMRQAERQGICKAIGFAPTISSRGSPKVFWRSLIYAKEQP